MKDYTTRLIIFILSLAAFALADAKAQYAIMFRSFDEQDGMSNETLTCLEVDAFGYIWIGSKTGLSRYDGIGFTQMSSSKYKSDVNAAIGNTVADLLSDPDGNMWIATEKGVTKFDIYTNRFTFIPRYDTTTGIGRTSYQSDKVYIDKDNNAFFYSPYHQLHKFDPEKCIFRPIFWDFFKNHDIRYCHKDSSDCFWLMSETANCVYKLSHEGKLIDTIDCSILGDDTPTKGNYCFLDNNDGTYYFGGDNGLILYDETKKEFRKLDAKNISILPPKETKCLFHDSQGNLWIGTNAKELFKYNPRTKMLERINSAVARSPFRINSPTTIDIIEDKRGLLWFGTWKGLSYTSLKPQKDFMNVTNEAQTIIARKNYISTFTSHGDTIAIGSDGGGITFWRKGSPAALATFDPADRGGTKMLSASVLAAVYDHDGNCYNGGYNRTVTRIHPDLKTVDEYKIDKSSPTSMHSDFTVAMVCDKKNKIWVLTNGDGLYKLEDPDRGIFRSIKTGRDGSSINSIWGICLAEYEDKILIGTYQGLSVYDTTNDTFTNYECDNDDTTTLSHNWVNCFCIDAQKRIWVGTNAGLDLFDIKTGKFTTYDTDCGLLSDAVQGMASDDKTGLLWVATAKGITKFSPEKGRALRTYLNSDGLLADNFMLRAAHKDYTGTMYFGVSNGFTYFKPDQIRIDSFMPMPTITRLSIEYEDEERTKRTLDTILSNKAPEATDRIVLDNHETRRIIVQFATLNYVNQTGNKYSYILEGYEDRWIDIGTRHEVVLSNLPGGDYTFKVKCRNMDDVESEERPLKIHVKPTIWENPLIWVFIGLLAVAVILTYLVIHNRRVRNRQRNLEMTVKKRTEDLVMANVSLEIQKEEIEKSLNSTLILNDLSRQITSSFDMETITMTAYNHVKMIARMDFFALGRYSQSKNMLEFNDIYLDGHRQEPTEVPIDSETTEAMCYNSNEDSYSGDEATALSKFRNADGQPFGTLFVLPVREASKPTGILTIGCLAQNKYTSSDRANLRMITSYLSIALEKAKDYQQLQIKNNAINGSIRYAKTIQDAILAHEQFINQYFNAMIIFRPKDIVSGDFYWFKTIGSDRSKPEKIFAAVIDCTGHGVPGAFMSLISNILLNDIIIRNKLYEPDLILSALDKEIVNALNQADNNNDDGLDMAICRFDQDEDGHFRNIVYAGAKNSLYHYMTIQQKVDTIAADRMSIGGFNNIKDKTFTPHHVKAQQGDIIYMTSDGIIDQNNKERKRFGRVRFVKTIELNSALDMQGQKSKFEQALDGFMDGVDQRDDITIMGLRIS